MAQDTNQNRPADVAQADSVGGMAKRLLNPAHLSDLARRSAATLKDQGAEQLWRDVTFRVGLAFHHDSWQHRADLPLRAAVITLSDKGSRGEREDKSGPLIVEMLTATGYKVEEALLLPDDAAQLKTQLLRLADARQVNLILTTGGTGFAPRDITPEVTLSVAERNAPGIAEAMRYHSLTITPRGMLSRGVSVLRGKTLIVNLPGSPKAVKENLEYILPSLAHGIRLAAGLDGECARK